ncbi:P-type conjugative transfer ATPase TrbB [Chromobacterium piscinae]|uniref:P-type conjugative transfer ATPase TrbB n=1 Tax=Chromobacterium piscinae TaxID=686831 RepID=UPI001E64832D|nr:P-type conjugative transfer ATPase TrbB [Chromobacterium piscinae]MCD5327921.1 P-type conjugative transfer ATPase TrbB [Chromobacterium piscinae]
MSADQDFSGLSAAERVNQERLLDAIRYAFGPDIMEAMLDPKVVEVMLNDDSIVWVDRLGEGMAPLCDRDGEVIKMLPSQAASLINNVATMLSDTVTVENPILEGELPLDGSRFEALIPPVVERPIFAIRKKASLIFTLNDYVKQGVMTLAQADYIRDAVRKRQNILVVGGTGSGKTTLVNAVLHAIAELTPDDRMLIIEDTRELQCSISNKVLLRATDTVPMQMLLKATMRLRPDRICVGEVRDGAALTLLKAWNTGHPGGCATVHANGGEAGLLRIDQLIQEVSNLPQRALIAEAVNVILYIERTPTGRKLREMIEVNGYDEVTRKFQFTIRY